MASAAAWPPVAAPDVPTEQPKGTLVPAKRQLIKKLWNDLTTEQQEEARNALTEWLEEQGYGSCSEAAEDPEASKAAAEEFLNSPGLELTTLQKRLAMGLLKTTSKKGMSTTITLICIQIGLS